MTDEQFQAAANIAAEQVKEPGDWAQIGNSNFVVGVNSDGELFMWDRDMIGNTDAQRGLIPALAATRNKSARAALAAAWLEMSKAHTRGVRRRKAQGAADALVNVAAKYARYLRASDPVISKLSPKRWKSRAAKTAAEHVQKTHGKTVNAETVRKRL